MTGFGRAELLTPEGRLKTEIKTVNHKSFDVSFRLPPQIFSYEAEIRKALRKTIARGRVYVSVSCPDSLVRPSHIRLNEPLAREYLRVLHRLGSLRGKRRPTEPVTSELVEILRLPDVISRPVTSRDVERAWSQVRVCVVKSLAALEQSRREEGRSLHRDLYSRSVSIHKNLTVIRVRSPKVVAEYKKKLTKRYAQSESLENARERFRQEMAAFEKACDISEEVVRLNCHIGAFRRTLREKTQVGRKIDFIAQEMIREANTIAAKAGDYSIAQAVIRIKLELEKIREQAQNVE